MKTSFLSSTMVLVSLLAFNANSADLVIKKAGKAPAKGLYMKSSKVPQFPLVQKNSRVNSIPKLDIGSEPEVQASELKPVAIPQSKNLSLPTVSDKQIPQEVLIDSLLLKPIKPVANSKVVEVIRENAKVPEAPHFAEIKDPQVSETKPKIENLQDIQPIEMKKLQALIFLESQKNYPIALSLFAELLDEVPASEKTEINYQIGLTAKGLELQSDYKYYMGMVLKDPSKTWQKKAAISLYKNATPGDTAQVATLDPKLEELGLIVEGGDQYNLNRAKYYLEKNDLTKALAASDEILLDSPLYINALYLKSIIMYKSGQLPEAIGLQQLVVKELEKSGKNADLKSVAALTLARMFFQAGQYKDAFDMYLKVDKKHPEWMQAMIEQAWTQILAEDYEGAAGNMFSLHTDFFKKSFAPESYVVRTVGYLNLCQYGDGAKTVYDLKKRYTPFAQQLIAYKKAIKKDINYYDTVKTWARNPDIKTVDGLPREFIATLTKHPSFISEQEMINNIEDQMTKYNNMTLDLVKLESTSLQAQNEARAKLLDIKKKIDSSSGKTQDDYRKTYQAQEQRVLAFKIQQYIAKKARNGIKTLRTAGMDRLEKEESHYRERAANAIKYRFDQMLVKLSNTLDQSEVLQYEIYSGAGEHLRYQMAGGDINAKDREQLKVNGKEAINWEFKGEVWEDELGHFRSGLKNVCPKDDQISQSDAR